MATNLQTIEVHGGELAFQKGTRVALHDQRPPHERDLTLRDYVLSGSKDLIAIEKQAEKDRVAAEKAETKRLAACDRQGPGVRDERGPAPDAASA